MCCRRLQRLSSHSHVLLPLFSVISICARRHPVPTTLSHDSHPLSLPMTLSMHHLSRGVCRSLADVRWLKTGFSQRTCLTAAFNVNDAFDLESRLTQEEKMIRDNVHSFCQEELMPRVVEDHRKQCFDRGLMRSFGSLGILGTRVSGFACPGPVSDVATGLICRELERVDSGYRSVAFVQSTLVMNAINVYGSQEQKERYLPRLASGDIISCFGLTDPDHGSDIAPMETTATWQESSQEYVLTGSKRWIINSPIADVAVVWARSVKHEGKIKGFLIDRSLVRHADRTFLTPTIDGMFSLRTAPTGMIIMKAVRVPADALLPMATGLSAPFACLNETRMAISWAVMGAAEFCLHQTLKYVSERKQFGRPLAQTQLIQRKLADALTDITLGLNACYTVTRLKEAGKANPEMISMIKRNNCQKALDIARSCRDMLGGNGISDEYHVIRHCMNLESVNTYEGTSDVHALVLGRAITGLQAFK